MADLTPKQALFVQEYLVDLNATQAAIRAGYSETTAHSIGHENLSKPEIVAAIAAAQEERSKRTEITQDMVLRRFWSIATANANDLIEYRRCNCRYCWGAGFRFQETQGEQDRRRAQWEKDRRAAAGKSNEADFVEFNEMGGVGYHAFREPNPDCIECFGQGVGQEFVKDTRDLPADAAVLYAGVKVTREGLEVKMHDQANALLQVGRHLGMFTDKADLNLTGVTVNIIGPDADL